MGDEEAGDAAMLNADNCPCGRGLADTVMNECRQGGSGSAVSCAAPHCRFGAGEGRRCRKSSSLYPRLRPCN